MITKTLLSSCGRVSAAAVALAAASAGQASGFAVPEMSLAGLGLANAVVANADEIGALPYNPAAMAFLGDASLGGGAMVLHPPMSVSDTLYNAGTSFDNEADDWVLLPLGYGHVKLNEDWFLGVSFNAPLGLETRWPSAAFGDGFAAAGAPGMEPTRTTLELLSLSPSLTYKINDNAALAAGFDLYWVRELHFDTTSTRIDGDGTATGLHLAGLVKRGDWSFGASYYSGGQVHLDGQVNPGTPIPAEAVLDIPWRAQIGARYMATERLGIEFDVTRTGWSRFDRLEIDHAQLPVNLVTSTNGWQDVNAYRLGVTYELSDNTGLRFGYAYDETPEDDDHFTARIPDADRHLFSAGLRHSLSSGWDLEAGYMYVGFKDRSVDLPPPTGSDPNGSFLYNGEYASSVHLFGLGISKRF